MRYRSRVWEVCAPFLALMNTSRPFMDLPRKENGLDIEGLTVFGKKTYIGMRGPVVDNIAIIAAVSMTPQFAVDEAAVFLHFVDLDGLGVRDLARWNDSILILAGPSEPRRWTIRAAAMETAPNRVHPEPR